MANTFPFKLVTPTGVIFEGSVEQVTAVGQLGEFGVLADHVDFITSLAPGLIAVKVSAERTERFLATGGFAEVRGGAMTITALGVETPEQVKTDEAAAEAKQAEERFSQLSFYQDEYQEAERELLLARARQRAAELKE
jgi:F-type H+-transporting ATPase subunit epsilon